MAFRSGDRRAPVPDQSPSKRPPGRDWRIAVTLGLLFGQLGYLYTRQRGRFGVALLLGVLALALSGAASYHEMPSLTDPDVVLAPDFAAKVSTALGLPVLVSVLNNIVCAVDLFWQAKKAP